MRKGFIALPKCIGITAGVASLLLASCSGDKDVPDAKTNALIAEAQALTPEKVEAKANEISQNDYRMFRVLMAAGGLDEELGGAAQGDAALRGLMVKLRQQMLGTRADFPRFMKIADGDAPGFLGLGVSVFVGIITVDPLVTMSGRADAQIGKIGGDTKDGAFVGTFDAGKISSTSVTTEEIGGMKGKITTKVDANICPDANGVITSTCFPTLR